MMHDHIVNDLLTIAAQYESLRLASPDIWHGKVRTEMRRFLQAQQQHPPFQRFCQLYSVDSDEFLAGVLKSATLLLGGTKSN